MPKFMSNRLSVQFQPLIICCAKKKGAPASAAARARRQSPVHPLCCERKFGSAKTFFAAQMIKSRYSIKKTLHNLQLARHLWFQNNRLRTAWWQLGNFLMTTYLTNTLKLSKYQEFVSSAFAFVCFEISTHYFLKFQPIIGLKFQDSAL